ncbi:hypothetical protein E2I00_013879 [Balaenoptera physalus]|uniref:Gasdermin pore forming domain-containing protein n=1 Tax=Balaenoptera physalus TaxID=9770 RepID=A0A643CET0_BALPH|nr:hypothetical protein E2I00_013879 [Balaenoptera physalus]
MPLISSWVLFISTGQEVKSQVMDSADLKGSLTVKLPKEKTLEVGITFSRFPEQGIELSKTWILQKFLDSLKNKKLKRKLPPTFQSIQAMREDLYLVTETLKTTKTVILKSEKQYILGDPMKCFGLQYEHKHQTEVTITPEKVLGYRVKQLIFPNAESTGTQGLVEPILEQNWGEQPRDVGCDPEARTLCALYVVVSILLQMGEKPTSLFS